MSITITNIENYTSKTVYLQNYEKEVVEITSSGIAQVKIDKKHDGVKARLNGKTIHTNTCKMSVVTGLPEQKSDTILIVSLLVYNAVCYDRTDVYVLDNPFRDNSGNVQYNKSISRPYYV